MSAPHLDLHDQDAFAAQVARHHRALHVHCYRMLGSFQESEDLVQETFLRAWRRRETYAGRASVRAWLYRIATNACLDALDKRPRALGPDGEVLWLEPYPDTLLDEVAADTADGPDAVAVERETIELAFLTAIQHLAPLPRAVLVLRDVLDLSARETAETLETSVASVNSALQRARAGLREHLPAERSAWAPEQDPTRAQQELLARYVDLSERADAEGFRDLLHEDVRFSMPPTPGVWVGHDAVIGGWVSGGFGAEAFGEVRCRVVWGNRQPAVAAWVRRPDDARFSAMAVDVLRFAEGRVIDVTTFGASTFGLFGLPAELDG